MSTTPFTGYEPNSGPLLEGNIQAMQIDGSAIPLPPTPPGTQKNLTIISGPSSDHQTMMMQPSSSSMFPTPMPLSMQVPSQSSPPSSQVQIQLMMPQASSAHAPPGSSHALVTFNSSVGGTNLAASGTNAPGSGTETYIQSPVAKVLQIASQ